MSHRIRAHLRSNIVGYIAIFMFAIGGTAFAIDGPLPGQNQVGSLDIINGEVQQPDIASQAVGTDQIKNNQVRSPDIKTGEVQTTDILDGDVGNVDLAANSVDSSKVVDDSILGDDISNAPPFGTGGLNGDVEIQDGTISLFDIGANQVLGFHVADDSLGGADVNEEALDVFQPASTSGGGCTDDGEGGSVCAAVTVTLPQNGTIVANASGAWHTFSLDDTNGGPSSPTDLTDRVRGNCVLRVDGTNIGGAQSMGERSETGTVSNHPGGMDGTMALTSLGSFGAGAHSVDVFCTETDGDLDWNQINLTAEGHVG